MTQLENKRELLVRLKLLIKEEKGFDRLKNFEKRLWGRVTGQKPYINPNLKGAAGLVQIN